MSQRNPSAITAQPQQNGPDDQQQKLIAESASPMPGVAFGLEFLHEAQELAIKCEEMIFEPVEFYGIIHYSSAIFDGPNRIYMAMIDFQSGVKSSCRRKFDVNLNILNNFGQPVINGKGDFIAGSSGNMAVGQGPNIFGRCNARIECTGFSYDLFNTADQCFLVVKSAGCDACFCCQTVFKLVEPAGSKVISKIKRDWRTGTFFFGFPPGLDVRMKCVFLGALLLMCTGKIRIRRF